MASHNVLYMLCVCVWGGGGVALEDCRVYGCRGGLREGLSVHGEHALH